jgi:AmmeMemoRadiSam system protein B
MQILDGSITGLIAPHAVNPYSVQTSAYRQFRGVEFETVVILAPSHMGPYGVSVFSGDGYQTPLCTVPLAAP